MIRDIVTAGLGLGDGVSFIPTRGLTPGAPVALPPLAGVWSEPTRGIIWNEPTRSVIWIEPTRDVRWSKDMEALTKKPAEQLSYAFDFSTHAAILAGDTLQTVQAVTAAARTFGAVALSLGTPAIVGNLVRLSIGGGSNGGEYELEFKVQTAASQVVVGVGILDVAEES